MNEEELKAQSEHFYEFILHPKNKEEVNQKNIEEVKMYNHFMKNKFKFDSKISDKSRIIHNLTKN